MIYVVGINKPTLAHLNTVITGRPDGLGIRYCVPQIPRLGSFVELAVSSIGTLSFARLVLIVVQTLRLTAMKHGGFKLEAGLIEELTSLEVGIAHRDALGKRLKLSVPVASVS